jgi:hypothetical protein
VVVFIAVDRVQQADHAGLYQVIDFHRRRQLGLHVMGKTFYQRHVLRQQTVLVGLPFNRVHALCLSLFIYVLHIRRSSTAHAGHRA